MKYINKRTVFFSLLALFLFFLGGCNKQLKKEPMNSSVSVLFLHHSTGNAIWNGNKNKVRYYVGRAIKKITGKSNNQAELPLLFRKYNKKNHTNYRIEELAFPKERPYGGRNYPFDYYNIWVKNGGNDTFMQEPTLESLTKKYQVIVFKHCFPSSNIQKDLDSADIDSDYKSLANYKLQYLALREKLHQFPNTRFIVWTGAVQVKNKITEAEAERARVFYNWVKNTWDLPDDNIFVWDFYQLQTDGNLYFNNEYAISPTDSHPNEKFADHAAKLLFCRIIDVIENKGTKTGATGESL